MPIYIWPSAKFPAPSTSFGNKVSSAVISTKMDSGRNRRRKRFTRQNRLISVKWELTDDQYALFQGVYTYKLNAGADFFTISLPLGNGFKTQTVRFTDDPIDGAYKDVLNWIVGGTLELQSGSVYTEAETDAALA